MSVLIMGGKPPSGCRWCYFNDDGKCVLIVGCDYDDTNGTKRRKDCPFIELPDHGDLIDRDDVWHKMVQTESFQEAQNAMWEAPVVIPAERSEG